MMAWLAVDKKGEVIFKACPERDKYWAEWLTADDCIELPKGSIEKLIDRRLTWDDEPVEI